MKRLFFTLVIAFISMEFFSVYGQQIKGDFDKQLPWKSASFPNGEGETLLGVEADGWASSNVTQIAFNFAAVIEGANRTPVRGKSLKMINPLCGAMGMAANAPGYTTLGKTWVFADVAALLMGGEDKSDGGTVGGLTFSARPDSIAGFYKRKIKSTIDSIQEIENVGTSLVGPEQAAIIAYLWKGTFKSETVTSREGGMFGQGEYIKTIQDDQELCVLGKKAPIASSTGQLIAKVEYTTDKLTQYNDWTRICLPFDYLNDEMPEKLNVILSSANYYSRADIREGNVLDADDVVLVYNAQLRTLKVDGKEVDNFSPDKFDYVLPESMAGKEIVAVGNGKNSVVTKESTGVNTWKIEVTDASAQGLKAYTYTLTFKGTATTIVLPQISSCTYGDTITFSPVSNNKVSPFEYSFEDPAFAKVENGQLIIQKVGSTALRVSQPDTDDYNAASVVMDITAGKASLAVELKDTTSKYGKAPAFGFVYKGLVNQDDTLLSSRDDLEKIFSTIPVAKAYDANNKAVSASTKMGTYTIKWYDIPESPIYTITVDSADQKALIIGKGEIKISMNMTVASATPGDSVKLHNWNYDGLLSADRVKDPISGVFVPKAEIIKSGSAQASCQIPAGTPVGKYPIVITSDLISDMYDFIVGDSSYLSVKVKGVLTAGDNPKEVVYGAQPFALKMNSNIDQDPSAKILYYARASAVASIDNQGMITIKGAGNAKFEMYLWESDSLTKVEGSVIVEMTVNKAPLTITAKSLQIFDTDTIPSYFALEYNGFVNNEDSSKAFQTAPSASVTVPNPLVVGEYAIVVSPGESKNYAPNLVNGLLTVIKDPVSIEKENVEGLQVFVADKKIVAAGVADQEIEVYNLQGLRLRNENLASHTIYIVKIGTYSTKVLVP